MAGLFLSGLDFGGMVEVGMKFGHGADELVVVVEGDDEARDPVAQGAGRVEPAAVVVGPGGGEQQPVLQQDADPLRPQHGQGFFGGGSGTVLGEAIVGRWQGNTAQLEQQFD